jgi:nifR3 family TIM-barrel protein
MRDLELATRLIRAAIEAVAIPVTVKMRLGWDHESLNAAELARRAEALGARAVTVHGRTRQQFYKGSADWRLIREVVEAVEIPVIANGDVGSIPEARRCLEVSRAKAVMVGRAAVGRPWLVGQIAAALDGRPAPEPSDTAKTEAVLEHYEGLLSLYGREIGLRHARKHLSAYADRASADGYAGIAGDRQNLVTTTDPAAVVALLERLFTHGPAMRAAA